MCVKNINKYIFVCFSTICLVPSMNVILDYCYSFDDTRRF